MKRNLDSIIAAISRWDRVFKRKDCPYCHGSGKAPGDGRTECGFCN